MASSLFWGAKLEKAPRRRKEPTNCQKRQDHHFVLYIPPPTPFCLRPPSKSGNLGKVPAGRETPKLRHTLLAASSPKLRFRSCARQIQGHTNTEKTAAAKNDVICLWTHQQKVIIKKNKFDRSERLCRKFDPKFNILLDKDKKPRLDITLPAHSPLVVPQITVTSSSRHLRRELLPPPLCQQK